MAIETTISPWHIAVALGQPAPTQGSIPEAQWQLLIDDTVMFIDDRASKVGVAVADVDQTKVDFVVREVVVDQIRRRDKDADAEFPDNYRFRTVADWWPLLGLSGSGAFSVDLLKSWTAPSWLPSGVVSL